MAEVDSLEIRISASSEQAANAVNKLAESLAKLKNAIPNSNFKGFENLAKSLKELADTAKGFEGSIGALAKAANAVERLTNIKSVRIPKSIGDGIRNIGTAAEMVTPEAVENLDRMTRSLQRLQNVDLKGAGGALRTAAKEIQTASPRETATQEVESQTRGIRAVLGRLRERMHLQIDTSALKQVSRLAKEAWGHLKKIGQRVRLRIEAATIGKLQKQLDGIKTILKSLGRIAFYRAIRSAIKAITQAFSEGLKNAYAFSAGLSNAIDGRIAVALDGLTTKSLTMKNQLGAAFGSLLTAIAPIINALIGLITALANAITQLFAAFSGATFLKAKDTTAKFADDMKKGGGAAKEWKNQLMGFDEINRLEDQSGGGGGGGGSALNPDDMFEVTPIESAIKDFVDRLKKAVLAGKWADVGNLIGDKINEAIKNIKWADIGRKIGYYFNGAIWSFYTLLKRIDFYEIGAAIATLINKAIEQIDFRTWGKLLVRKVTAAFDLLIGLLGTINWKVLGIKIGLFIRGALDEASEWFGKYDWGQMAQKFSDNLIAFIQGLNPSSLAASLNLFISRALAAVKQFVSNIKWGDIVGAISDGITEFFGGLSPESQGVVNAIAGIALIAFAFKSLGTVFLGLKGVIDMVKLAMSVWPFTKIVLGLAALVAGFLKLKSGLEDWIETGKLSADALQDIAIGVGLIATAVALFISPWAALVAVIAFGVAAIVGYFKKHKEKWDEFMEPINGALANLKESWSGFFSGVITGIQRVITWLANLYTGIVNCINAFLTLLGIDGIWSGGGGNGGGGTALGGWTPPGGRKASGGYVSEGQLFIAREAGPELVGTMGGRTAVANNDQIVAGISAGVYEAVVAAMGGGGDSRPVIINLDGREIARSTTKYQNQLARARG